MSGVCQKLTTTWNQEITVSKEFDSSKQWSISNTYQAQAYVINACLSIEPSNLSQHTIRIILTSLIFPSENFLNLDIKTKAPDWSEDPKFCILSNCS